jgi:sortase A
MSALPHPNEAPRPATRRRSRLVRALAVAMVLVGSLALADVAVTLLWQEPISALIASLRQDHLRGELARVERAPPTVLERRVLASVGDERRRIALLAEGLQRSAGEGGAVGRIEIPRIGASFYLVKGTSTEDLESGPGIDEETPFPGIGGTTLIAGHRTTFLAPFRHIDELHAGSRVVLQMPYAELTYAVVGQRVVAPTDVQAAVAPVGYTRLVLSACTPLFSAEKRLLVSARLVRMVPRGPARRLPGGQVPIPIVAPAATPRRTPPRALPPVFESPQRDIIPPLV